MEAEGVFDKRPKKERALLLDEKNKLERVLSGIETMGGPPAAMFIVDVREEHIALLEAKRLHIPVIAIVDTNCNPDEVDKVIPGNDDAIRAIRLITNRMAEAMVEGRAEFDSRAAGAAMATEEAAAGIEPSTEKAAAGAVPDVERAMLADRRAGPSRDRKWSSPSRPPRPERPRPRREPEADTTEERRTRTYVNTPGDRLGFLVSERRRVKWRLRHNKYKTCAGRPARG